MRVRISNFLDITKSVILADLLWTDLTLLVAKRIFGRIGGPGSYECQLLVVNK